MSKENDPRDYYHDRSLPPIRRVLGEYLERPIPSSSRVPPQVTSTRAPYGMPPVQPREPARLNSVQEHHSSQSDPYTPQSAHRSRSSAVERPTDTQGHSYGVYATTSSGELVLKSSSSQDDYRQRPAKAYPGLPSRKYPCDQCHAHFDRPNALEIHKRTHSGEQPYQCSFEGCYKRFNSKGNWIRHEKTHYASSAFEDRPSRDHHQTGSSTYSNRRDTGHHYESSHRK